jgi:Ca-activated chloride channel family protein
LLSALPIAATRAEGPTPDLMQSGSLLLRMQTGYEVSTALDTDVSMQVSGMVARVSVRQRFANAGSDWAEGVYVFPLPESAAVDRMRLVIGERVIESEIREKDEARKEYEQAREEGRRTSLVEQERPNLFTTSVANIAPGETVIVEMEYLEELRYADGQFSLRFPLTLTPRYMPGEPLSDRMGSGWSADTTAVPDASRISPPVVATSTNLEVSIGVELDAGLPLDLISSRYHPVTVSEAQGRYSVRLASASVPMDHDFELVWRPAVGHAPQALVFAESFGGEPYYLLMLMPPSSPVAGQALQPREMIFIVDTSGSMFGTSIEQARAALLRALLGLTARDRFNIVEFNSSARLLYRTSVEATPDAVETAQRFVRSLVADGGTEMRPALELALRDAPSESHLRQVVFITDGAVGNEEELFALIEERLGSGRLFTIGIGSAPNSWFMRKSAEVGRGTFTMISALSEVGEKMDRLFAKLERPQVTGITVEWPSGTTVESYPAVVPDLYADLPLSVRARMTGSLPATGTVLISGNTPDGAWRRELSFATGLPTGQSKGVAALWARGRIDALMDAKRRGLPEESAKREIVDTALEHHLVSPYTSLVAVDRTPSRTADTALRRDTIAGRLPWGQDMGAIFGLPSTATNAAALMRAGCVALLLALLLAVPAWRREYRRAAAR